MNLNNHSFGHSLSMQKRKKHNSTAIVFLEKILGQREAVQLPVARLLYKYEAAFSAGIRSELRRE